MALALVGDGWWRTACQAANEEFVILPPPVEPPANPYSADVRARMAIVARWRDALDAHSPELILDNGGAGLAIVHDADDPTARLFHESIDVPLVSHWIDPLVTVFQSMPWPTVWQCMHSDNWFKCMWDRPQTDELSRFGIPRAHRIPMAAPDRDYDTRPLRPQDARALVSFVGGQNTSYFFPQRSVPADMLLCGSLAHAVRADMPDVCFFDVYYHLYRLAEPPTSNEPIQARIAKAQSYFAQKLFYNAAMCIRQRDRFVIFLKQKLGDTFTLIGDRWNTAYGLTCLPPFPTTEEYFAHFRRTAINLNLVNGNTDSGLNMRHFEITAAGGFMLCYHQPEIEEFFEVGKECDTFRNEQELLEKVRYYLEHSDQRVEIAAAGQRRTLSEHLYSHRLQSILKMIRAGFSSPSAVARHHKELAPA